MDYEEAHRACRYNRKQIAESQNCGCFCCRKTFTPEMIKEWINEPEAKGVTVLCPFCSVDSVLGSAAGYPLTEKFLLGMHERWFGSGGQMKHPNQEQLDVLKRGVQEWNARRSQHPEIVPDLTEANLAGYDLKGVNFGGVILRNANLTGADLCDANLRKANLRLANVSHAKLEYATLNRADCFSATFSQASLCSANLTYAKMKWADLSCIDATEADMRHTDFSSSNLHAATLTSADCGAACFFDTTLTHAKLIDTNLNEADLTRTHLQEALLQRTDLCRSRMIHTDFTHATLLNCRIEGAFMCDVILQNTRQENLIIASFDQDRRVIEVTIDDMLSAYMLSALLQNQPGNRFIKQVTTNMVLISRNQSLQDAGKANAINGVLLRKGYLPLVFHDNFFKEKIATQFFLECSKYACAVILDVRGVSNSDQVLKTLLPQLDGPALVLHDASLAELEVHISPASSHFALYPVLTVEKLFEVIERIL